MFSKINLSFGKSLGFRLAIGYALIASLFAIIAFGIFYYKLVLVTLKTVDGEMFEEVAEFSELFLEHGVEGVKTEIAEENASEEVSQSFFRLFDSENHIIATTDMSAWGELSHSTQFNSQNSYTAGHMEVIHLRNRPYKDRIITTRIAPGLFFQHGQTLEATEEYLKVFRELFIVVTGIALLLAGVAGSLFAKKAVSGMNQVTQTAKLIARGRYHERVRVDAPYPEINHLADTFNVMVERIEDLINRMREVTENIAHDLRSPLARIRGIAEMSLISKYPTLTPSQVAENTIEECDALIETINTMLDLTEIEAGVQKLDLKEVSLNQVLEEACELFRPLAREYKIAIDLDINDDIVLSTDSSRLQRLVYNLLDNAIKYSSGGGNVLLRAQKRRNDLLIEVKDEGDGISKEDIPYIFDRFYRADQSRSKPGTGLGLSLVKAISKTLGGSVQVDSQLNTGSRFSIILPIPQLIPA